MDENVRNSVNPSTSEAAPPATSCTIGVNDAGTGLQNSTPVTQRCSGRVHMVMAVKHFGEFACDGRRADASA